jgi:hypothetical protein
VRSWALIMTQVILWYPKIRHKRQRIRKMNEEMEGHWGNVYSTSTREGSDSPLIYREEPRRNEMRKCNHYRKYDVYEINLLKQLLCKLFCLHWLAISALSEWKHISFSFNVTPLSNS